jgi:succinate dehydrogenase/fumarate reductase flavoprotein subunit
LKDKPGRAAAVAGEIIDQRRLSVVLIIHYNVALCNSLRYDGSKYSAESAPRLIDCNCNSFSSVTLLSVALDSSSFIPNSHIAANVGGTFADSETFDSWSGSGTLIQCDVLVVGGGGSGLAAAITAAEAGTRVVLLEKAPALGGSTGWSIGSITAAGTPDQRAVGIVDSAEDHLADMPAWAGPLADRDNMALCEVLTAHAADTLAWLRASGLEFFGPVSEPPHRKPRMHNVLPNSKAFIYHLSRRARRAHVDIRLGVAARRLVQQNGRVVGLEAVDQMGAVLSCYASKGIILAGGDFSASRDFKIEFGADTLVDIPAVNVYATGDCQRMAREVGAVIVNADIALGDPRFRFAPPAHGPWWLRLPPVRPITSAMKLALRHLPARIIRPFVMSFVTTALAPEFNLFRQGALLLNKYGETFLRDGEGIGYGIARQPEAMAYALLDEDLMRKFSKWPNYISTAPGVAYAYIGDYMRNRADLCAHADALEDVAAMRGIAPNRLLESARAAGKTTGPFLLLGPIRAYMILADGGLDVSPGLEVLDQRGKPIPGLYAAGSAGQGGLLLRGHGHHLAWAFVSGRVAGKNAAAVPISPTSQGLSTTI